MGNMPAWAAARPWTPCWQRCALPNLCLDGIRLINLAYGQIDVSGVGARCVKFPSGFDTSLLPNTRQLLDGQCPFAPAVDNVPAHTSRVCTAGFAGSDVDHRSPA
jgi:hypothetical protein